MEYTIDSAVALGNGVLMPRFGLGVWQVEQEPQLDVAVKTALECGYKLIDTAEGYYNEDMVGRAIERHGDRKNLFITTKLWNASQPDPKKALGESLKKLNTDYVDLYLIHWPRPKDGLYPAVWQSLVALQKDGFARAIGVSNFNPPHLERIIDKTGVVPAVNQVERHPFFQQDELAAYCRALGIAMQAYSPLASGKLGELTSALAPLAEKHGKTVAQIVLRWQLQTGWMLIPKSVTPARIEENADIFDFELDPADLAAIKSLENGFRILPDAEDATF